MDRFIKVLKNISCDQIVNEVENANIKNSSTLNKIFENNYSIFKGSSKTRLITVWKLIIENDKNISAENWNESFVILDKIIKGLYKNEGSYLCAISQLKKVVKDKYGASSTIYKTMMDIGITDEKRIKRDDEYKKKVILRNDNRDNLPVIFVEDIENIIHQAKQSNNDYDKAIAVLLASGVRSIDLLKVAIFDEEKGNSNLINIKNFSKTRGVKKGNLRPLIGLKADEVIKLIGHIRMNLNIDGNNADVINRRSGALNNAFKKYFEKDTTMSVHKCRYIYANCAYILYGEPQKKMYESYIQSILGHASADSTKAYLGINIQSKANILKNADKNVKKIYEAENARLKAIIENMPVQKTNIDFTALKNSFQRTMQDDAKINNIIEALKTLKANGKKMKQSDLRTELGYSAKLMSTAYQKARQMKIL